MTRPNYEFPFEIEDPAVIVCTDLFTDRLFDEIDYEIESIMRVIDHADSRR